MVSSAERDLKLKVTALDDTKPGTTSAGSNFDKLKAKVDSAGKSGDGFAAKFKGAVSSVRDGAKAALPYTTALGAAVVAFAVHAGKAASDAEQSLGATQQVFGKTADAIIAKSKEAATKYGLSANDYRESANLIGSLFKNQGVAQSKLASSTDAMIAKASDLAAVFGGTTADAVDALSSAFKGEFDPLERYGVSLKQSTVNAEALRVAHVKSVAQFNKLSTAQQTAANQQATLNLINKQTADSTGQFSAQTNTSAEKLQIAKARYENLSATIGAKLLPVFNKMLEYGNKLTDWISKHQKAAIVVGALVLAVWGLNAALAANPIVLVAAAIAALVVGVIYAYTHFKTFRDIVNDVWGATKAVASWFAGPFVNAMKTAWNAVLDAVKFVVNIVLNNLGAIIHGAASAFGWIPGIGPKLKSAAKEFDSFRASINNALDGIKAQKDINIHIYKTGNGASIVDNQGRVRVAGAGLNVAFGGGTSWAPSFASDSRSRTGGPTPTVHSDVSVSVYLDGEMIQARIDKTVKASEKRTADRQKVGKR